MDDYFFGWTGKLYPYGSSGFTAHAARYRNRLTEQPQQLMRDHQQHILFVFVVTNGRGSYVGDFYFIVARGKIVLLYSSRQVQHDEEAYMLDMLKYTFFTEHVLPSRLQKQIHGLVDARDEYSTAHPFASEPLALYREMVAEPSTTRAMFEELLENQAGDIALEDMSEGRQLVARHRYPERIYVPDPRYAMPAGYRGWYAHMSWDEGPLDEGLYM